MPKFIFKILVAGDGAVGKTTLLYRYVQGFFKDTRQMTIGVDFHLKNIELGLNKCQLLLYDFAGQERFRFMIDQWIYGAQAALLLYDITSLSSFENLEKWLTLVRKEKDDLPVLLVATKCDLGDFAVVDQDDAIEFGKTNNMLGFVETSSKEDYNVEYLFEYIVELLIDRKKEN